MNFLEGAQRRRHADRLVADIVDTTLEHEAEAVARLALDQVRPHVRPGGGRRGRVEVDIFVRVPPRHVDAGATEARNPAHQRIDDGLDEGCRDRRVDRIAARSHRLDTGLCGLRLRRYNHSALEGRSPHFLYSAGSDRSCRGRPQSPARASVGSRSSSSMKPSAMSVSAAARMRATYPSPRP